MSTGIERIEQAFRGGTSGCRRTCECGVEYYDFHNTDWDWEEGELEELEADEKAVGCDGSVGEVWLDGKQYVDFCSCWHDRARKYANFIDANIIQITNYIKQVRRDKEAEAGQIDL